MLQYLVLLGALVNILGTFSYIKDTLRGITKPNKITWLMWSIAPMIATLAALSKGVGWAALPVFMAGFAPLLVFIASFINPNSYWKLEKFDYICGTFSFLALILWGITKDANIAIIFSIASDFSAGIPTLCKSWKYPETESVMIFVAGLFSSLTSFFAIKLWNFSELAFPIYLNIMNSLLILAIILPKYFKKRV